MTMTWDLGSLQFHFQKRQNLGYGVKPLNLG